ncbi:MAG: toll/interleukin-1 receptor domain-containing protein [Pseudomonadota bacterium]
MKEYDVFISHASEDKSLIARPLAKFLRDSGFRVWFDEFELGVGDSLRRAIDKGLSRSNYGVVVLSSAFFSKGWTNYEYDGLVQQSIDQPGIILPIWSGIEFDYVAKESLPLANIVAERYPTSTRAEIGQSIAAKIGVAKINRRGKSFVIRESESVAVSSTDIEKGFVTASTVQSDRIVNSEDTIVGTQKVIMPIRDQLGFYEFFHWKSDPGDIEIIRFSLYDKFLNSLVDSEVELVEHTDQQLRARIHFEMRKNRFFEFSAKVKSRNYFQDLYNTGSSRAEFVFVSGMKLFEYELVYPQRDFPAGIKVSLPSMQKGEARRERSRFLFSRFNVRAGTNLEFGLQA